MTATAAATAITISTTPLLRAGSNPLLREGSNESGASPRRRSSRCNPLVGLVARGIAGITGALLGLAIGLVSAGFDTTRLSLVAGAAALGFGCLIALVADRADTSTNRR